MPKDENGIDVPLILEILRRKIRNISGFEVVEDFAIATFSFAKHLIWKDLVDRADQLRHNRLVKHLIDGAGEAYGGGSRLGPAFRPSEIDRRQPSDLVTPLPADSSQLAAVIAASEGGDFILEGPPGTGKSQTIANIVAQCLANGENGSFRRRESGSA